MGAPVTTFEATNGPGITQADIDANQNGWHSGNRRSAYKIQGTHGMQWGGTNNTAFYHRRHNGTVRDFTTTNAGDHLFAWYSMNTDVDKMAEMSTADRGIFMRFGSDTNNINFGRIFVGGNGSEREDPYPITSGYQVACVDPTQGFDMVSGTPNLAAIGQFGGGWRAKTAGAKNFSLDGLRLGIGLQVVDGVGSPASFDTLHEFDMATQANRYGVIVRHHLQFIARGKLMIGDGTVATEFEDSNQFITFPYTKSAPDFHEIIVRTNATATWGNNLFGPAEGITVRSVDPDRKFTLDITGTLTAYGSNFINSRDNSLSATSTLAGCTFTSCGATKTNGATIDGCKFIKCSTALIADDPGLITNSSFSGNTTAIEVTQSGTYSIQGLRFGSNGVDILNSSGGLVTLQVENDSDIPTFFDTTGSVTVLEVADPIVPTAEAVATAVWERLTTNTFPADSFGEFVQTLETEGDAATRHTADVAEHDATQAAIAALENLDIVDIQAALTNQGYTITRSANLDNLDVAVSSRQSESDAVARASTDAAEHDTTQLAIAALAATGITISDVQTAMTNQGLTTARTTNLDNLDVAVSSRESEAAAVIRHTTDVAEHDATQLAIAAIDIGTELTAQGYTAARASNLDNLDVTVSSRESENDASTRQASDVAMHAATIAAITALNPPTAAATAQAVWSSLTTSSYGVGTFGEVFKLNVDAPISSRLSEANGLTRYNVVNNKLDTLQNAFDNVDVEVDESAIATAVWESLTTATWSTNTFGELVVSNLNASVASRQAESSALTRHATDVAAHTATLASIAALSFTADVQAGLNSNGYTVARAANLDNLDTSVSSRLSTSDATANQATLVAEHDDTQASIAAIDVTTQVNAAMATLGYTSTRAGKLDNLDNLDTAISSLPSSTGLAAAVWDETMSTHTTVGTSGNYLRLARDQSIITANNTQM